MDGRKHWTKKMSGHGTVTRSPMQFIDSWAIDGFWVSCCGEFRVFSPELHRPCGWGCCGCCTFAWAPWTRAPTWEPGVRAMERWSDACAASSGPSWRGCWTSFPSSLRNLRPTFNQHRDRSREKNNAWHTDLRFFSTRINFVSRIQSNEGHCVGKSCWKSLATRL